MPTALVTGATSGIGAAFARRFGTDGYDLVLVARDQARLAERRAELLSSGARSVQVLAADLADQAGRDAVCERLESGSLPVDVLVNNAGMGLGKSLGASSREELRAQLGVNVTAVLDLTRAALPGMVARGRGGVINISSVAGSIPGRGSAYGASKAWVTTFTESVAMEVRGRGVRALAVCPGFVRTEFHERAAIDMRGKPGWMYVPMHTLVDRSITAFWAGRTVIVPGPLYSALVGAARFLPRGLVRVLAAKI